MHSQCAISLKTGHRREEFGGGAGVGLRQSLLVTWIWHGRVDCKSRQQTLRLGEASEGECGGIFSEQLVGCHAEV
jgi:hypothetical protein